MELDHKVYIVVALRSEKEEEEAFKKDHSEPDWFFSERIPDYHCSCQMGKRRQGTCVHIQSVIQGATLTLAEKKQFRRSYSILKTDNFRRKVAFDENDAEEGEEYLEGM